MNNYIIKNDYVNHNANNCLKNRNLEYIFQNLKIFINTQFFGSK
jgi:hypothetical protein